MKFNSKLTIDIVFFVLFVMAAIVADFIGNRTLYYVSLALIALIAYNITNDLKKKK